VKWPSDGITAVYPNGTTWATSPRETDTTNSVPFAGLGPVTRSGADPQGNPETVTFTPSATGVTATQTQQGTAADGSSAVEQQTVSVDTNGNVTSISTFNYANSSLTNINQTGLSNTDIATETTQQLNYGKLTEIANQTKDNGETFLDPGTPETITASLSRINAAFARFAPPNVSVEIGTCPLGVGTIPIMWGASIDYDWTPLCTFAADMAALLRPILIIGWTVVGIGIILRA
jgi:hypothetical protein